MSELVLTGRPDARTAAAQFLVSYSGNSRAAYTTDLRQWFEFCGEARTDPLAAGRVHVDAFKAFLESRGFKPATLARKISVVRNFFSYCISEQYIGRTPVPEKNRMLHIPAVPQVSNTPAPGRDEATAILRAAAARSLREYAVIRVLAYQALRVSELAALDLSDMWTERGHRVFRLRRKGGKEQLMAVGQEAAEAIDAYLRARGTEPGPLFLSNTGGRMTRWHVSYIVEACCRDAGVRVFTPHGFRHACATFLIRERHADIHDVKEFLGHASVTTTERYVRAAEQLDNSPVYALAGAFG